MAKLIRWIQWIGIALAICLVGGLFLQPQSTLDFFWSVIIPILPATFLLSPLIWRSVCPLAALNRAGNRFNPQYTISSTQAAKTSAVSISLFLVLVPARRFLFNENPIALAFTVLAVMLLAFILGTRFKFKSGFCNAICPVLPVEKLYGQSPLVQIKNTRCSSCSLCTAKGCLDIAPEKGISKVMGSRVRSDEWLKTPLGVFAIALPGFILGYFTLVDSSLSGAIGVYVHIVAFAASSYLIGSAIVLLLKIPFSKALPIWASISVGIYYWYASAGIAAYLGASGMATTFLRAFFLLIVGIWLVNSLTPSRKAHTSPSLHS